MENPVWRPTAQRTDLSLNGSGAFRHSFPENGNRQRQASRSGIGRCRNGYANAQADTLARRTPPLKLRLVSNYPLIFVNAPLPPAAALFSHVEMAPRDPILGVNESFNADSNPNKVNLGVGVYTDEAGKIPVLECVKRAEVAMAEKPAPRGYLPIDGIAAYDKATQALVFGAESAIVKENRAVTVQTLGGTGALKVGADFLKRVSPASVVYISNPSWENHRALFESAGFEVRDYAYYDAATSKSATMPITMPRHAVWTSRDSWHPSRRCHRAASWCCTPAATTRPVLTRHSTNGKKSPLPFALAGWCPSSIWPIRVSVTVSSRMAP